MKYPDNMTALSELPVDMMGMIFYSKSARYIGTLDNDKIVISANIKRVGVFVNEGIQNILKKARQYDLDFVQLHGNESPDFCKEIGEFIPVIKAFSIANISDIEHAKAYEGLCTYFLFDTKTPQYGGSGQKFDWKILDTYEGSTPFLLSGGISIADIEAIKNITHVLFHGVDLNSRFEFEAGLKDISLLDKFIKEIKR